MKQKKNGKEGMSMTPSPLYSEQFFLFTNLWKKLYTNF